MHYRTPLLLTLAEEDKLSAAYDFFEAFAAAFLMLSREPAWPPKILKLLWAGKSELLSPLLWWLVWSEAPPTPPSPFQGQFISCTAYHCLSAITIQRFRGNALKFDPRDQQTLHNTLRFNFNKFDTQKHPVPCHRPRPLPRPRGGAVLPLP